MQIPRRFVVAPRLPPRIRSVLMSLRTTARSIAGLPPYIARSAELVQTPPYQANGINFFGFVVPADMTAIQRLCDSYLNAPLGYERYVASGPLAMFVWNTADQLMSSTGDSATQGFTTEAECAVWTLVLDTVLNKVLWFHPYMFVDSDSALASGREVYGFPKQLGRFTIPRGPGAPAQLECQASIVKTSSDPPQQRTLDWLVRAQMQSAGIDIPFASLGTLILGILASSPLLSTLQNLPGLLELLTGTMPMVFLKQFRDGPRPTRACFQSVQYVDSQLVTLHDSRVYGGQYTIDINDAVSHPIRADLGLPAGTIQVATAFWVSFDFSIGTCVQVS